MKALVTGGAGFMGYHLARVLVEHGEEVTIVDNLSRSEQDPLLRALLDRGARLVTADLTTPEAWASLRGFDVCYHLAAVNGTQRFYDMPDTVLRVNLLTALLGAEAMHDGLAGTMLWTSSSEAYAGARFADTLPVPTPEDVPLTISDVANPRFSYASSKIAGESIMHAAVQRGADIRIVRPHNVFGPRQPGEHVIPAVIGRLLDRLDPLTATGAEQTRAFCYVDDAVDGVIAAASTPGLAGRTFNVGDDGNEVTVRSLVDRLIALADYAPRVEYSPAPVGSVDRRCPDTSALRAATGWAPRWSLDDALAETFRSLREERALRGA